MELKEYAKPISYITKSNIGILVLHGFTGCIESLRYYINKLKSKGYNIEAPALRGHGTHWEELGKVKYEDWVEDATAAYEILKKRCDKIFIAGLSMGGTLALYLAYKIKDIAGIILINHGIFINDKRFPFACVGRFFVKSDKGVGNDIKDKTQNERAYETVPTEGVYQLFRFINKVKSIHKFIVCPVLIIKSIEDHVVKFKSASFTYDRIRSDDKEIIWLKNSYHVATMDYDKDIIIDRSLEFISRLT